MKILTLLLLLASTACGAAPLAPTPVMPMPTPTLRPFIGVICPPQRRAFLSYCQIRLADDPNSSP